MIFCISNILYVTTNKKKLNIFICQKLQSTNLQKMVRKIQIKIAIVTQTWKLWI